MGSEIDNSKELAGSSPTAFSRSRIKVCGMTSISQIRELDKMGVDFAGMIFYAKSPRFVIPHIKAKELKAESLKIAKVGVFVNASYDEVMKYTEEYDLNLVQLHGDETPHLVSKLADNISVIKAFRITDECDVAWKTKDYYADTDMYMFDTQGEGFGGTGKKFNWTKLKGVNLDKPFFLSGGIEPGDEAEIRTFLREPVEKDFYAVDINSKFEIEPGVKDMEKVKEFVRNMKSL